MILSFYRSAGRLAMWTVAGLLLVAITGLTYARELESNRVVRLPGLPFVTDQSIAMTTASEAALGEEAPGTSLNVAAQTTSEATKPRQVYWKLVHIDVLLADEGSTGADWMKESFPGQFSVVHGANTFAGSNETRRPGIGVFDMSVNAHDTIASKVKTGDVILTTNPKITTNETEPAQFRNVTEIPFRRLSQSTSEPPVSTIEYEEVGAKVSLKTSVTPDGQLKVEVVAEVSKLLELVSNGPPKLEKSDTNWMIRMRSGQTFFISDLRRKTHDDGRTTALILIVECSLIP